MLLKLASKKGKMRSSQYGSREIAEVEKISRRAANYMKDREGFPAIEWVGRTWRVNKDEYEAWRLFSSRKRGTFNA